MANFSTGQEMLTLALLATRRFWDPATGRRRDLAKAICRGLSGLEPLQNQWELVWGPGTYRYLGAAFDGSMMFVVRHRTAPNRHVIVIRGTNPVDLFDWLLGDFLAHRQVPWYPEGSGPAPDARVSLSTALGLRILLGMRAETAPCERPEPGRFDHLLSRDGEGQAVISIGGTASATPARSRSARDRRRAVVRRLPGYQKMLARAGLVAGNAAAGLLDTLPLETVARVLPVRRRLVSLLDRTMDNLVTAPTAVLMSDEQEAAAQDGAISSLLAFLAHLSELYQGDLDLVVTGHSKGGALAPALALFLSDTQRAGELDIAPQYRWNRHPPAALRCYAYAGPTPGNTAFADYFNGQLGRMYYRYANTLDLVPLAWQSEEMRRIAGLYGDAVAPQPGLDLFFSALAEEVETLDYCHPGRNITLPDGSIEKHIIEYPGEIRPELTSYLLQETWQHVQGYLAMLGLQHHVGLDDLLG